MNLQKMHALYLAVLQTLDQKLVSPQLVKSLSLCTILHVHDGVVFYQTPTKLDYLAICSNSVQMDVVLNHLINVFKKQGYDVLNFEFTSLDGTNLQVNNHLPIDNRYNFSDENKTMTFDNYVVSDFNTRAKTIVQNLLTNKEGNDYNPVFLFGSVGIGKTHLVLAAANAYAQQHQDHIIYYTEANDFFNKFAAASAKSSAEVEKLKNEMKQANLLVLDDIQNLASKEGALDLIFTVFNTIKGKKDSKIIITSDKPSKDLKGFPERLLSRFGGGIQCRINIPSVQDVIVIIKEWFARNSVFNVHEEVIHYIANNYQQDIRQLIGMLKQIKFWSQEINQHELITKDFIDIHASEFGAGFGLVSCKQYSIDDLIDLICKEFNLKKEQITSSSRLSKLILARKMIYYLACKKLHLSFSEVAKRFGKVHTTISYAFYEFEKELQKNEQLNAQVSVLVNKMVN